MEKGDQRKGGEKKKAKKGNFLSWEPNQEEQLSHRIQSHRRGAG
jgi:hypothetical protein